MFHCIGLVVRYSGTSLAIMELIGSPGLPISSIIAKLSDNADHDTTSSSELWTRNANSTTSMYLCHPKGTVVVVTSTGISPGIVHSVSTAILMSNLFISSQSSSLRPKTLSLNDRTFHTPSLKIPLVLSVLKFAEVSDTAYL